MDGNDTPIGALPELGAVQGVLRPASLRKPVEAEKVSFGAVISEVLDNASAAASKSRELNRAVQMDDPNVTLEESVIASNVSSLYFTAVVQIRNKVMQAYTDIMNMPV